MYCVKPGAAADSELFSVIFLTLHKYPQMRHGSTLERNPSVHGNIPVTISQAVNSPQNIEVFVYSRIH